MIRRFAIATATGATLMVSLTACLGGNGTSAKGNGTGGGDSAVVEAAAVIKQASQKSSKIDTMAMDVTVKSDSSAAPMSMHATTQYRIRPTVAMKMNIDTMTVKGQQMPGGIQAILLGHTMYMKMAALSQMTGGKPWFKLDLQSLGKASGLNLDSLLDQARQNGPAEQTQMLTGSKNVHKVGTETVNGVQTTHYTGTVTTEEALAKLDASTRQKMQESLRKLGATAYTYDIWVNSAALPVKIISRMAAGSGTVTTTSVYSDYGKPVHITAPPASEVGAMPNLSGIGGA
jgi:hypothetical protein